MAVAATRSATAPLRVAFSSTSSANSPPGTQVRALSEVRARASAARAVTVALYSTAVTERPTSVARTVKSPVFSPALSAGATATPDASVTTVATLSPPVKTASVLPVMVNRMRTLPTALPAPPMLEPADFAFSSTVSRTASTGFDPEPLPLEPVDRLRDLLVGLLPDAVAAPFMEKAGIDRLAALHAAIDMVRRGGTISLSGVYGGALDPMPLLQMFDKQLTLKMGQANVRRWVDDILPLLTGDGDPLGVDDLATHQLPLDQAPQAYETFQKKQDGAIKIVLKP